MYAAIYPGQGSQQVGMGKFLFDEFAVAKQTYEEASDAISVDLKKLCFEGPEEDLALTENTQPALLTTSIATQRVIDELFGITWQCAAGHSIGEYAAVVASGAMPFADGVRSVKARGQAMQAAVPVGEGGMLAVMGLSDEQIDQLCKWTIEQSGESPLEPANYNSPGQIVISGSAKATQWLEKNFTDEIFAEKPQRVRLIALNVSAPFHCSMMKPAEEKMREVLDAVAFSDAKFPIIQNFTAEAVTEGAALKENLVRQVSGAVLWTKCVQNMASQGVKNLVEVGHGRVLAGLVKKIDRSAFSVTNLNSLDEINSLEKLVKG